MVLKKLYEKILNSSNSFKFYKKQYKKLKLENTNIWKDIRHKDKVIKDKDNQLKIKTDQINILKKEIELFKSENKLLLSENEQLQQYKYDMQKLMDKSENIKNQYMQTYKNLTDQIETLTSKSNKILSYVEFSQVESSNNFDELISNLEKNMKIKKEMELFKSENKVLLSENEQLRQYKYDMQKIIDRSENIKNQYIQTSENLTDQIETLTSKSNKILSYVEFSQVESSNNFDELISNLEDNMKIKNDENHEIQKHLEIEQQEE